jgi:MFS family permease
MFLSNGMAVASFISRIPAAQTNLRIGASTLGVVLAALSIGVVGGLLNAGRLVPRLGSRRLTLAGATLMVLALPLTGFAAQPWTVAGALLLVGFGASTMDIGQNAQAVGVERGYGRSIMVGMHGAWSLGTLLGALGGSLATATATSVGVHLTTVAAVIAALVVGAARWLRVADRAEAGTPARFAFPRGALFPLALVALAAALGENTAGNWSGIHLRDVVGTPAAQVTWGYVAYTAAMVTVRLVGDRAVRRFGTQRVVTGGGWLAAAGFTLVALVPSLPAALLGFVSIGLGLGSIVPSAFARAGRVARTPGEGVAAVASIAYLAFLIGPPTIGWITEVASLPVAFLTTAVAVVVLVTRPLPDA